MIKILILAAASLGLSESIEPRLPKDPGMIYHVGFKYSGVKVGLDWKNRQILTDRICRKSPTSERSACQRAAAQWLVAECSYYEDKRKLNAKQRDMRKAVCTAAEVVGQRANQVAQN